MKDYPYPDPSRPSYDAKDDELLDPDDFMNTSSAADCTGLMPAAAISDNEFVNYTELYNFLPHPAEDPEKRDYTE